MSVLFLSNEPAAAERRSFFLSPEREAAEGAKKLFSPKPQPPLSTLSSPPPKKKNAYTTKGKSGHVNYATVPSIVYTWPECASVGQTEEEVKASGTPYKTGKFAFMANSRARASDDAEGVVKFIAHAETDKILGAHIMGPNAGELIGTFRLF